MEEIKTKQEICDILGVTTSTLRKIESRDKLYERLHYKGYRFIEKIKCGRTFEYKVVNFDDNVKTYTDICDNLFETKLYDEFSDYFLYRILNLDIPVTKRLIANLSNVDKRTVGKWDGKMVDNDLIKKDGYWYVAVDYTKDGENVIEENYRITDKYEYDAYMKNSRAAKKKEDLKLKYVTGKIDLETYELARDSITRSELILENKFVYRISKYKLPNEKALLNDIYKLVFELYGYRDSHRINIK